jgi:putative protein-disulfide isomerase
VWDKLETELAEVVAVKSIVGGLAPDSNEPMPEQQRQAIAGHWHRIQELLGAEFNHSFWQRNTPRRSTYPACRAVIAARWQNAERAMIHALQEAYYLRALNPSDLATLLQLADELSLDTKLLESDIKSEKLQIEFAEELAFAHSLPIQGFPSMVLLHNGNAHSIILDYRDHLVALEQVRMILTD